VLPRLEPYRADAPNSDVNGTVPLAVCSTTSARLIRKSHSIPLVCNVFEARMTYATAATI
jgi:hypothetical protein